jgi:hypothetical protein
MSTEFESDEPLEPCQTCFREAKECLLKRVGVHEKACYCEPMFIKGVEWTT